MVHYGFRIVSNSVFRSVPIHQIGMAFCCSFLFDLAKPVSSSFFCFLFLCLEEFVFLLRRHLWSYLYVSETLLFFFVASSARWFLPLLPPYVV